MRTNHYAALIPALLVAVACGGKASLGAGASTPGGKGGPVTTGGHAVSTQAAAGFDKALDQFVDHDKKGDWSEASCVEIAQSFSAAAKTQQEEMKKPFPEALYNAGLAYARCDKDADARAQFEGAVKADAQFHRARAQLALYDYAKSNDTDATIRALEQIIRDAKFQNVEALVSLAALQMERANEVEDQDGKNDFERAQRNLQRALAIDDSYMPAFNQLAIYYLERAKAKAEKEKGKTAKGKKRRGGLVVASTKHVAVDEQQLDLAALVAGQAVRKNPNYAPIHNTAGLIQVELRNYNGAVKSFGTARRLDPKFFEAHMNYAAVNLLFRGYSEAEKAYRDALKLHPNEFEAHLGLALALRGQIDDSNFDKYVAEAQEHLDAARKIDANRPETYYNEAILTQEYRAKAGQSGNALAAIPILEKAAQLYQQFVAKAGSDPNFADASKRAKDRSKDITDTIAFLKAGEEDRKKMEEDAKQQAAAQGPPTGEGQGDPAAAGSGEAPPPEPPKQ